jgi:hypothetical protein
VIEKDPDVLRGQLDALSGRIESRLRELDQRGTFSAVHSDRMDEIRKRSATISQKLDAAMTKGGSRWEVLKYELERDFHALNEDFALFEARLDAEAVKESGKAGPA